MLKACSYCGRIHDSRVECKAKQDAGQYARSSQATHTRNLSRWQKTREYIRRRDGGVCQLCLRNYEGATRPYEGEGLSVHHIVSIETDVTKAFDEDNLITLCRIHHEQAEKGKIDTAILQKIAKENGERYRGCAEVSPRSK